MSEDGETALTFEGYDNKGDMPTEGHAVIVAAFRDSKGNVFYQRMPAESASATGFYENAWAEMDKLDDDVLRRNERKSQKAAIDSINEEIKTAQKDSYRKTEADLQVDISDRFLRFTPNVYGGLLAALTTTRLKSKNLEGAAYGAEWDSLYSKFRQQITNHMDTDQEFYARLRGAKNNKEALSVFEKELREDLGADQETIDLFKQYVKLFNTNS